MPWSTTHDNALLGHAVGKTAMTMPAALWVGLVSTSPTKSTPGSEPAEASYGRAQIAVATQLGTPASSRILNTTVIEFGQAAEAWASGVDLVAAQFFDQESGGSYIGFASLATPKPVAANQTPKFAINDLAFEMT